MKTCFLLLTICITCILCAGEVFYVHGFLNDENTNFDEEIKLLEDIYPGYKITVQRWDAKRGLNFDEAKANAEKMSIAILNDIMDMPEAEQQDLIVVGHSLGGRCVAYLASKLKKYNIKIKRLILLGAAIGNDKKCLYNCGEVSRLPAKNLYCKTDLALNLKELLSTVLLYYVAPAGKYGISSTVLHKNMDEYECVGNTTKHKATFYLRKLKDIL